MLSTKDRGQLFNDLKSLMGEVLKAYNDWKKDFKAGNASLDALINDQLEYEKTYLAKPPANDSALEELAMATGVYLQKTRPLIEDLRSEGTFTTRQKTYQNNEYQEILRTRDNVEEWIDKVLTEPESPAPVSLSVPAPGGAPLPPSASSLFIALLEKLLVISGTGIKKTEIIKVTKQLYNNQSGIQTITLTDAQISALLEAWQQVVTAFSDDPIGTTGPHGRADGTIEAIIGFGAVHSDLEILYNQLTTNVNHATEDSLDSLLFSLY